MLAKFALAKMATEKKKFDIPAPPKPTAIERGIKEVSKKLGRLGEQKITKKELKQIKKQVKQIKPQTEKEKKVEQLAGRKLTIGQIKRYAGIGAGVGAGTHILSRAIRGGDPPWLKEKGLSVGRSMLRGKAALSPRQLASAATIGGIYFGAIPAARRVMDIEAAKRGKF